MLNNRRQNDRVSSNLTVEIAIGSQVVIQGQLRDLSSKGAFIRMKSSVFLQQNDELNFQIKCSSVEEDIINGEARISRIVVGEGIAIYFTKLSEQSTLRLQQLLPSGDKPLSTENIGNR